MSSMSSENRTEAHGIHRAGEMKLLEEIGPRVFQTMNRTIYGPLYESLGSDAAVKVRKANYRNRGIFLAVHYVTRLCFSLHRER